MRHLRMTHRTGQRCDDTGNCPVCNLFVCELCRGFEGGLPTDCPGVPLHNDDQHLVYDGRLDFVRGHWIVRYGREQGWTSVRPWHSGPQAEAARRLSDARREAVVRIA